MEAIHAELVRLLGSLPEHFLKLALREKLKATGATFSERQLNLLCDGLIAKGSQTVRIERWKWWDNRHFSVEFTDDELRELEQRYGRFVSEQLPKLIASSAKDAGKAVSLSFRRHWPKERRRRNADLKTFQRNLMRHWREPLDSLELLQTVASDFGAELNGLLRLTATSASIHRVDVLTRLHARACQVTSEIIGMLQSGFADGAMARWRTLHEIAITAIFISEDSGDLAERYINHDTIESFKAAKDYQGSYQPLGLEPLTKKEFAQIRDARNELLVRYGHAFASLYGWAAEKLGREHPTFIDIEGAVGLRHLQPYYRLGSHNVHANPKGVYIDFNPRMLPKRAVSPGSPASRGVPLAAMIILAQVSPPTRLQCRHRRL